MDYANIRTGTGGRILPKADPDQRALAEHIGFVVMVAAQLDATLSGLVDVVAGFDGDLKLEAWGRSGRDLVQRLKVIEEQELAPEVVGFADRYDRLYRVRNQVVHSIRMEEDPDHDPDMTVRLLKQNAKRPSEGLHARVVLGVSELIDLWYELRDFNHEVMLIFLDYASRSKWAPTWVSPGDPESWQPPS
ncbi:hypothetical protein [Geodermatophilus sp. CPCC 205506]|uniref:hypothetical protein n=1 Tax=Geodermatophilus sp. CPCC 205506 TaxID=2936596 RepID=UPI003EE8CC5B